MAEEPDSLILEHLRAIRGDMRDIKAGFPSLARRMDTLQSEMALIHRKFSDVAVEMGQITSRLDHIERRLELADAP